ncbi:MAG: hypothetical protein QM601_01655 [Pseudoxanthomonas sp.]
MIGLALLLAAATTPAKPPVAPAATPADLQALVECRKEVPDFYALEPLLGDPARIAALGWTPLPRVNPFMTEYRLPAPIEVFGSRTNHIAFAGSSIIAVLDLPDPRPLAHRLQLETGLDTPQKALFGKQLRVSEKHDPASGRTLYLAVILNVSNVDSHPGKTLAGCTYDLDTDEAPADPPPATPATSG